MVISTNCSYIPLAVETVSHQFMESRKMNWSTVLFIKLSSSTLSARLSDLSTNNNASEICFHKEKELIPAREMGDLYQSAKYTSARVCQNCCLRELAW